MISICAMSFFALMHISLPWAFQNERNTQVTLLINSSTDCKVSASTKHTGRVNSQQSAGPVDNNVPPDAPRREPGHESHLH